MSHRFPKLSLLLLHILYIHSPSLLSCQTLLPHNWVRNIADSKFVCNNASRMPLGYKAIYFNTIQYLLHNIQQRVSRCHSSRLLFCFCNSVGNLICSLCLTSSGHLSWEFVARMGFSRVMVIFSMFCRRK